jgi:PAS domain S-box-containing protein
MSTREELLEKRLQREIKARKEAESLLESKTLELYQANKELLHLNHQLEKQVDFRNNQLIQNELKYNTLIDNMDIGLIEVDKEHRILKANGSFLKLMGYTEDELLGMDARTLMPSNEFGERINSENDQRLESLSNIYENCLIHKDGRGIWVLLSGTPVYNTEGEVVGSIGIYFDITYTKDLQRKLEQARKDAEEAREAVDKCAEEVYTVIFMDLQMPEMNGYEAALAIRNQENPNCEVPIIALTASAIQADRERAFQYGMNDFLSKPITPTQLSDLLGKYWSDTVGMTQPVVEKKPSSGHLSFDLPVLREFYGDDLEYAKEMFDLSLSESEKSLPALERAVDRMDRPTIKAIAHRIKPSVRMVGFTRLSDHLQNLERASEADDGAKVTEAYGHFRKHQSTMLCLVKEFSQDIESGTITHI